MEKGAGRGCRAIRILVAEESGPLREIVREYLEGFPLDFEVVGAAGSTADAARLAGLVLPDVVVIDPCGPWDPPSIGPYLRRFDPASVVVIHPGPVARREVRPWCLPAKVSWLSKPFRLRELRRVVLDAAPWNGAGRGTRAAD